MHPMPECDRQVQPRGRERGQDEPMGVNNRQRRAAKRRQKQPRRESPGVRQPGVGATGVGRHDSAPDDLIAFAVAHLWPDRHPAALAGVEILAETASVPGPAGRLPGVSRWLTRSPMSSTCRTAGRCEPGSRTRRTGPTMARASSPTSMPSEPRGTGKSTNMAALRAAWEAGHGPGAVLGVTGRGSRHA
jgi:hypothetical protein